ncbi:hypothetical protein RJ639_012034 [Escallonia herrerae]|uniref:Uncharacterized protein n=1 Tax=Escallonia herrerae TaxID=1293975 RepID=A0AA89AQL1_9ASTE|nr:hypothetical protein RJ639_012034 [Escallonia herrerae]
MEKEEKNQRACKAPEADLFLQWGNRKRLRCVRVRDPEISKDPSYNSGRRVRRRISSRFVAKDTLSLQQPSTRLTRHSDLATNWKLSPEKEDKYYATRGSVGGGSDENGGKVAVGGGGGGGGGKGGDEGSKKGHVWPKLYITLSSKEKEEDFLAMKGCKPPQRPKKRAKVIQRTLLLVSPGAWLTDMCQERYEVREKKSSKKRPRGLKAMGSMDSDSE